MAIVGKRVRDPGQGGLGEFFVDRVVEALRLLSVMRKYCEV